MTAWFGRRWRGQVPAYRLWWHDMLVLGTSINVFAGFAALMSYALGAGMAWALLLHFGTLPLNLFLYLCLWRRPERTPAQIALASLWIATMMVV
jgi:hypothetical protein